jgi:tetratricopeptide (TPR) repeat protein
MSRCALAVAAALLLIDSLAFAQQTSITADLQEADRRAWLTDWYGALPFYEKAENEAVRVGDRRSAMYAKFGRLRGQMQTVPLVELSEQLAADLATPLVAQDPRLRLRGLTVKGDVDLDSDVQAAQRDWQEVAQLAREIGDKGWENRAVGELAMVAFMRGNTGQASTQIQQALQAAIASGDVGGQVRYMGAIANGQWLAGNPQLALAYADRALKLAKDHPETGFPFVVYSTKALALVALNQPDEAESFANAAMTEAEAGDRRIKETELLMILGQIAQRRQQPDRMIDLYTRAATAARAGHVQRLAADAEANLADVYRSRGELAQARKHALASIADTRASGSRFTLPIRLAGQARRTFTSALATLDLADATINAAINDVGQLRDSGRSVEARAIDTLAARVIDGSSAESITAVLEKSVGADLIGARQKQARIRLLNHVVEQLLVDTKRARDTESTALNMQLTTWQSSAAANRALVDGAADALTSWRQP